MPDYKSNILAEYRLPRMTGAFFNFDWQHVGRRPIDDINSSDTPQYNRPLHNSHQWKDHHVARGGE